MPSSTSSSSHGGAPEPLATRLTAADRPGVAQPVPERPVPDRPWGKTLLAATALALLLCGGGGGDWRDYGVTPGSRDDNAPWGLPRRAGRHPGPGGPRPPPLPRHPFCRT